MEGISIADDLKRSSRVTAGARKTKTPRIFRASLTGLWRSSGDGRFASRSLRGVDEVFQFLAGLEKGNLLGRHFDLLASFRITPDRPRRWRVRKLPNPRISILSPFCRASMILSKMVSTIVSDSFRGSSAIFRTSSIRSAFVNVGVFVIVTSLVPRMA